MKIYYTKGKYKNYHYEIETEFKDGFWESSLNFYEKNYYNVCSKNKNKNKSIQQTRNLIHNFVDEGKGLDLFLKDYSMYYDYPINILKDIKDGFIYHVSDSKNIKDINQNGLIPNGDFNKEVYDSSVMMDLYKPYYSDLYRTRSIYTYYEFGNYNFSKDRSDCALWAININNLNTDKMLFGSQGLAGFCMCDIMNMNEVAGKYKYYKKEATKFAKLYWKHAFFYNDFMKDAFKKANKKWGIDELLYCGEIPTNNIEHIGNWNKDGVFTKVNSFNKYVNFSDYEKIIKEYQMHYRKYGECNET